VNTESLALQVVPTDDDDAEDVHDLSVRLRATLLDLDVASVDPVPEVGPDGAKGLGTVLGALMVGLGAAERIARVLRTIGAWVRHTGRTVEIRADGDVLKLTNVSAEQQNRLIDAWLERHAPRD